MSSSAIICMKFLRLKRPFGSARKPACSTWKRCGRTPASASSSSPPIMLDPIRYLRLGYVALRVTDLTESLRFYVDLMGLQSAESADGSAWLRCSVQPYD